jgi:rare lipoprotein A
MTAACNVLPLGTWIRVTNLRNGRTVIVKINDRLHPRMKRIVDLSRSAAQKLNYIRSGLTRVKVEVLEKKNPEK